MKKIAFLFMFLILVLVLISFAATIPQTINVQGVLADAKGDALVNKTILVNFQITGTAGSLWQEDINVTTDENGIFNVILGASLNNTLAGVAFDDQYNLDITIDPKGTLIKLNAQLFTAVPYALNSHRLGGRLSTDLKSWNHGAVMPSTSPKYRDGDYYLRTDLNNAKIYNYDSTQQIKWVEILDLNKLALQGGSGAYVEKNPNATQTITKHKLVLEPTQDPYGTGLEIQVPSISNTPNNAPVVGLNIKPELDLKNQVIPNSIGLFINENTNNATTIFDTGLKIKGNIGVQTEAEHFGGIFWGNKSNALSVFAGGEGSSGILVDAPLGDFGIYARGDACYGIKAVYNGSNGTHPDNIEEKYHPNTYQNYTASNNTEDNAAIIADGGAGGMAILAKNSDDNNPTVHVVNNAKGQALSVKNSSDTKPTAIFFNETGQDSCVLIRGDSNSKFSTSIFNASEQGAGALEVNSYAIIDTPALKVTNVQGKAIYAENNSDKNPTIQVKNLEPNSTALEVEGKIAYTGAKKRAKPNTIDNPTNFSIANGSFYSLATFQDPLITPTSTIIISCDTFALDAINAAGMNNYPIINCDIYKQFNKEMVIRITYQGTDLKTATKLKQAFEFYGFLNYIVVEPK